MFIIHLMNISGLDLNLLPILAALLEERHVTRAAQRVGLSQPAMSNALNRLRKLLEDPLLVRGKGGMMLTPKAEEMKKPLEEALAQVEAVLAPGTFDPLTWKGVVALGCNDHSELVHVPKLCRVLAERAPKLAVRGLILGNELPYERLSTGAMDVALGYFPHYPDNFYRTELYEESFICLVREGHPLGDKLTMENYLAYGHVLVAPGGRMHGMVDDKLEELGLKRHIAASVGHFLIAPRVIAATDYITTLPKMVALEVADDLGLRLLEPPLPLTTFRPQMIWHERTHRDPAYRWFRKQVASIELS